MSSLPSQHNPGASNFFKQILRSVGLNVVNFIFARLLKKVEPKKTVISTSFWFAFSRCWVHFLPVSISIFLIHLNIKGCYLGKHLRGPTSNEQEDSVTLAFIQVAAKILELLIIASLTDIIIQVVRDGLLHDSGIPFGIATSGFCFDRLQYFWSSALWGGLRGFRKSSRLRGMLMLCVIVLGGFIAAVAGPASAVLLLPRVTTWELFDTRAWLNGTDDQFWPERLTRDHIGGDQCKRSPGLHCVNKLLPYLLTYYSVSQNAWGYQISPPEQKYPRILDAVPRDPGISAEAWSIAPHAATSFLLGSLWYDPRSHPSNGKPPEVVSGEIISKAAAVRTVCSRNAKAFDHSTPTIPIPLLSEYSTWAPSNDTEGPYINVSIPRADWKTKMMANPGTVSTVWIPPSVNTTATTAGMVVFDQQIANSSQRNGVVCSIDARWNRAKHLSSKSISYGLGNKGNVIRAALSSHHVSSSTIDGPLPIKNAKNWRHISADLEWLDTLTYSVSANGGKIAQTEWLNDLGYGVSNDGGDANSSDIMRMNTTYLANIILTQVLPDNITRTPWDPKRTTNIETVVSTVVADAISRIGLAHLWSTPNIPVDHGGNCSVNLISGSHPLCPLPSNSDDQMVKMTFNGSLTGYAYKSSKPTDYMSITVLSLYIVIALAHVVRLLITKRTSVCWDSVEELILLARTSDSPTKGTPLENTSAGISTFQTMALTTRIRTRAAIKSKEGQEDLQLLIEKGVSPADCTSKVKDGGEYGVGADSSYRIQEPQHALSGFEDQAKKQANELIAFFLSDIQLHGLITEAFQWLMAPNSSRLRFCALLEVFGKELGHEATNTSHEAAALLLHKRADSLAIEMQKASETSYPASSDDTLNTKVEQSYQDQVEPPSKINGGEKESLDNQKPPLIFTEEFKHFVLSSQAFTNLQGGLHSMSFAEPPNSILNERSKENSIRPVTGIVENVSAYKLV